MKMKALFLMLLLVGLLLMPATFVQAVVAPQPAKGFSILGEVRAPNKFIWHEGMTLLRALVWVQGFTPKAVLDKTVILRPSSEGESQMVKVDLVALMKGNADDVQLKADDIVIVPSSDDIFFVLGAALAPGKFQRKEGMGLRQAISLARGVTFNARMLRTKIYRHTDAGQAEIMSVDLAAVMNGKQSDLPILAGDIIHVPHTR